MQHSRNRKRADRISNALKTVKEYDGALDWATTISDALSDLRHLCDRRGLCFGDIDRTAYGHYIAEADLNRGVK